MNILVCVKQVPGSSNVEVDPVTGVLKRDGVASKMNPYDLYGIELALSLVETYGGKVETITMGPPQAKSVIVESVCMGAVCGTVLSDRKFAGADVLATAYTLSQACGKRATLTSSSAASRRPTATRRRSARRLPNTSAFPMPRA